MEINGGDDVDENDDHPIEPLPNRRDVRKAVSTITRYIDGSNDLVACKLEVILGSFSRQLSLDATQNMETTVLTDYFKRA